jgi:hypothetical protein
MGVIACAGFGSKSLLKQADEFAAAGSDVQVIPKRPGFVLLTGFAENGFVNGSGAHQPESLAELAGLRSKFNRSAAKQIYFPLPLWRGGGTRTGKIIFRRLQFGVRQTETLT